ncbi:hypothetical protein [Mucilaginibacter koreensis]
MKTGHQRSGPARPNRMISYLEQTLERRQKQVALYLDRKTQHWNRASKLILLLLICLLFGGSSVWLLIQACH